MKYLMEVVLSRKKEISFIFFMMVVISLLFVFASATGIYKGLLKSGERQGLEFFYEVMNAGILVWNFIICILFIPNLFATNYLIDSESNLSSFIKIRMGKKRYIGYSFLTNFVISTLAILLFQIFILLFINFCLTPIIFNQNIVGNMTTQAQLYSKNELMNLVIFVMFTSVGYGVFSNFIFSLQRFVKNVYIFRILGVIVGLVLYTGPVILGKILLFIPFIGKYISLFFIGYLINPGVFSTSSVFNSNVYISFIVSIIIYSIVTLLFYKALYKKEINYD